MEEKGYIKVDQYDEKCVAQMAEHYKEILRLLGEDPEREGLLKSPERIAKAMLFFTNGYDLDPEEILRSAMFHEDYKQMVVVKDIELYSLCEHHMVPFVGKAHVAYIPNGTIVGLSKIPRVVDAYARRLQVQERLTPRPARSLCTSSVSTCINAIILPNHEENSSFAHSHPSRHSAVGADYPHR